MTLEELVAKMVKIDKEEALKENLLKENGFVFNSSIEQPPSI